MGVFEEQAGGHHQGWRGEKELQLWTKHWCDDRHERWGQDQGDCLASRRVRRGRASAVTFSLARAVRRDLHPDARLLGLLGAWLARGHLKFSPKGPQVGEDEHPGPSRMTTT